MANTAPNDNTEDFDEDLDEEFIDDFSSTAQQDKKDAGASPMLPPLRSNKSSAEGVKNLINLAIIGSIALALIYFGYSYYKKSRAMHKTQQAQIAPLKTEAKLEDLTHKPTEELNKTTENPGLPANNTAHKIENLEFEINPKDKSLNSDNKANNPAHNAPTKTSPLDALASNAASKHDLDQALAPDSFKVLKPVEDLFDNDHVPDKAVHNTNVAAAPDSKNNNDYLKETIASMAEEITLNVNHIKQLEATITQVNKTLDQVTQALTKLDTKLSDVSNALVIMDQDVNNIKKVISNQDLDLASLPNKISQKGGRDPLVYSTPDYVVHAIIPGRAWLKSTGGQIITVTEGDALGDYGKVAAIDATNNIVRTSSGITFR